MSHAVLTSLTATVDPADEDALVQGFHQLLSEPLPDGALRTELLRSMDGTWTVQTLWRDREALLAVRAGGERPAAMALFDRLGAGHTHEVFEVSVRHPA